MSRHILSHSHESVTRTDLRETTIIASCPGDTVVRNQSCNMGNDDDRNRIRQQRPMIEKQYDALTPSPSELLVECRSQVETAWYQGIIPSKNLLNGFIVVSHGDRLAGWGPGEAFYEKFGSVEE